MKAWMGTDFLAGEEKYQRRVDKVNEMAERHLKPLPPT